VRWSQVTDPDLIRLFIEPLEQLGIRYMITGGVASVVYGEPRFTRDIDLVLELDAVAAERFAAKFSGGDYYVPPVAVLEEEASRPGGGHFNVIHRETGLRADIYVAGDDAFHHWAIERRARLPLESLSIWVAPIVYVIVRKLTYYRMSGSDRHVRDVASMLRVSSDTIDPLELDTWAGRLGVRDQLRAARDLA
jgi:hypothetical protein